MDDPIILCTLLPGRSAVVHRSADLGATVRLWRRRLGHDHFLPVAGVRCDPDVFMRVTRTISLPNHISVNRAAAIFCRIGMPPEFRKAQLAQLHRLGELAKPLLAEWRNAVESVTQESVSFLNASAA